MSSWMGKPNSSHWGSRTFSNAQRATRQQQINGEPWSLWIGDVIICAQVYDSMANAVYGKRAAQYCDTNKHRFGPHSSDKVDWDATEIAIIQVSAKNHATVDI
jgi:hypothetical protein